jgi:flagellar hook-associated protein 2
MSSTSSINLLSSSIDVGTIVDNLIYVDSAPVRQMQSQVTTLQSKVSAYQSLNTKISTLSDKLNGILFGDTEAPMINPSSFADWLSNSIFTQCKATSSDEAKISATASNATAGTYSIAVSSLAHAQSMASSNFSALTSETGTGAITITKGGQDYTVTIDSSNATLNGVCHAINDANAGVTATIINDGSANPYRLVIAANDTGTANSFAMTGALSEALSITTPIQGATDAQFTINGVGITKSSNSVSDAIGGVTLNLNALTTEPVTIDVKRDTDAIVQALQGFISSYNEINTNINSQFAYNATTKKAGILSGDASLRGIQSLLQNQIVRSVSNQFTTYSVAGQVGLQFNRDGSLSLDETKFQSALSANPTSVAALFLGDETPGFLSNLQNALEGITDPLSGPIYHSTDSLNKNIKGINDQISSYQERLDKEKEMLTEQFNAADQALRLLTVTQSSLSSQIAKL